MQDIITTKEHVQQFKRMQALQLWMIAEVSEATRREKERERNESQSCQPVSNIVVS